MQVSVNGNPAASLNDLESGSFTDKVATATVEVTLKKGFNKVQLSNASGWAPNIDCMEVVKI